MQPSRLFGTYIKGGLDAGEKVPNDPLYTESPGEQRGRTSSREGDFGGGVETQSRDVFKKTKVLLGANHRTG